MVYDSMTDAAVSCCEKLDSQLSDLDAVLDMVSTVMASPEASLHLHEAARLLEKIHPDCIGAPMRNASLRYARNAIWTINDPRAEGGKLVIKQPVRISLHKKFLDRFKPSKALRSWNGTCELLRRGVSAAPPVAFFESLDSRDPMANYYVCEHVAAECTARELALALPASEFLGVPEDEVLQQLATFLLRMHAGGIFFRDLSGGNILIRRRDDGKLDFSLIDTGRLRANNLPLSLGERVADLVRICNKMQSGVREHFLMHYLGSARLRLSAWRRLSFELYDRKVNLKRRFGRKGIKRLRNFVGGVR